MIDSARNINTLDILREKRLHYRTNILWMSTNLVCAGILGRVHSHRSTQQGVGGSTDEYET